MLEINNTITAAPTAAAIVDPVYPGRTLQVGSSSSEVGRMQTYLDALRSVAYPTLSYLTVDGNFGTATRNTVMQYQAIKAMTVDGVIGPNTWNTIVLDYNTRIGGSANTWPGVNLRSGSRSQDVGHMQRFLNALSRVYTAINAQTLDNAYGINMSNATTRFQGQFGLSADGVIGKNTWEAIVYTQGSLGSGTSIHVVTPYPGYTLQQGSSGNNVRFLQSYLNAVLGQPALTIDGIFGAGTRRAVILFQARNALSPDGIVGPATWNALIPAFNNTL